jgi:hypothetical protein
VAANDDEAERRDRTDDSDVDGDAERRPDARSDGGDDAAERVAEALGVGSDEGDPEAATAAEAEAEAAQNRASRRRDEALQRRKKKKGDRSADSAETSAVPKDRNARAKELLQRRREQAQDRGSTQLQAGERVDDALVRAASGTTAWAKRNVPVLLGLLAAAVLGGLGFVGFSLMSDNKAIAASRLLGEAVAAERGKVLADDQRSAEERELDPSKIFKTADDKQTASLNAYNQVVDQYPTTGPGILAKLGQAGIYLDKKDYDHALSAYGDVLKTTLAAADADVKGRAIEGIGFAKEGKGDVDGALASFKELGSVNAKGYAELALYHQARMLIVKADPASKDRAKDLLKQAHDKLSAPSLDGRPFPFLEAVVDDTLRKLDPSALPPPRTQLGGAKGSQLSPEELQALLKKAREAAEKRGEDGKDGKDDHAGE